VTRNLAKLIKIFFFSGNTSFVVSLYCRIAHNSDSVTKLAASLRAGHHGGHNEERK
jgi:hypothetical protein